MYNENTKPQKSDYTNKSMKIKGIYEAHELTREHGYLGEHRSNLEKGHTPGGRIEGGVGTSKLKDDSAGNIPRIKGRSGY